MFSVGAFTASAYSVVGTGSHGTLHDQIVMVSASSSETVTPFGNSYRVTVADTMQVSDVTSRIIEVNVAIAESVTGDDVLSVRMDFASRIHELAEAATYRQTGYGYSTGAFSSGSFDALGDYLARVSGDVVSTLVNVNSTAVETATVRDSILGNHNFTTYIDEAVVALDVAIGNITFTRAVAESTTVADQASYFIAFPTSVNESAQGSDNFSSTPNYAVAFLDGASGQDAVSSLAQFGGVVAEQVVIRDLVPTTAVLNSAFADSATVADNPIGNVNFRTVVLDSVVGSDSSSIRLQWELIDTYEASDWVLIDTFTPQS